MTELTKVALKKVLYYKDGFLYWKKNVLHQPNAGSAAGFNNGNGYMSVSIANKSYLIHRLVYLYFNGSVPEFIDHIDGNPSNNKISNLRGATGSQNQCNAKTRKDNTSGIKGVYWNKGKRKWGAQIQINNTKIYLGLFWDIEVAAQVLRIERIRLHGEFANHG